MSDFIKELIDSLGDSGLISSIVSIFGIVVSIVIVQLKTRKTVLEKKLISLSQDTITNYDPCDYLIKYDGKLIEFNQVQVIRKSDMTVMDYQKYCTHKEED